MDMTTAMAPLSTLAMASSSSSSSWLPAHGLHQVSIGTSLRRALKARKANGDQPASAAAKRIPDRDFYAFRYNFKPNSIDTDKPGSIDIHKTTDSTLITVKYPSKQNGETHVFKGSENVAKEWDCVLVYDEELGTFTLEKLDSHAALTHERKPIAARPPPPASPKPVKVKDDLEAQLEKDLLDLADPDADAEGEDDFDEIIPNQVTYRKEEEEEIPLEELLPPPPPLPPKQPLPPPPPRPPKKAQTKAPAKAPAKALAKESQPPRADKPPAKVKGKAPAAPRPPSSALPSVKAPPKQKQAAVPVPAPVPAPTTLAPAPTSAPAPAPAPPPPAPKAPAQSKVPKKREAEPAHLSDADEEVLEFGKPAKRTRKMSPAAPVSTGLALPGTSSSVAPPPVPSTSSSSSSDRPLAAGGSVPQQQQQQYAGYALPSGGGGGAVESESESEWSEVDPEAQLDDIFGDAMPGDEEVVGADIDEDEFEAELKMQMAEMEEEEEQEEEQGETLGGPMSLNDYARGVAGLSDEDTSTSEDSDDD